MPEISPALARAFDRGDAKFLAFYSNHPSGAVRFWTRTGKRTFMGSEWIGCGRMGRVLGVKRSTDLAINEVTFELSGVPPVLASQLSDKVRGCVGQVWLGAIDKRGNITIDTDPIVDARLDFQKLSVDPKNGKSKISIVAQQGFWSLDRAQDIGFTDQQQRLDFPGDCGFALVHQYENRDSNWRSA